MIKASTKRSSFLKVAEAIRQFYLDYKLLPRGLTADATCVVDWSVKQANGLQKLAPDQQTNS